MQNQIPSNWRKMTLDDTLKLLIDHRGITPKKLGGNWSDEGIPALSAKNIKTGKITNEQDIRFINENLYNRWMPDKLEAGDILLTSEAPLGQLYYLKEKQDYVLSQRLFGLRANQDIIDPKYLYYFLSGPIGQQELLRRLSGTAAEGIRQSELVQILVDMPEKIEEQERIVSAISAFDDKIEVNNKIARTLEEMAQAIFMEWFVKYRFPGYEKAEFVDSKLGFSPKSWKIKKLGELISIDRGVSYNSSGLTVKGLPMINLGCFHRGGSFSYGNLKTYSGRYGTSQVVNEGDIVIANTDITQNREIIGNPAIVTEYNGNRQYLFTHHVFALRNKSEYGNYFFYYMLRTPTFRGRAAGFATGTNVLALPKEALLDLEIVLPPLDLVIEFSRLAEAALKKRINCDKESQKLTTLRDLLLPKLMRGEIRV